MIHAESVKAWEAETEYFRSIIASKKAEIARLRAALEETNGILTNETYEPEKRIIYAVLTINKVLANEQEGK